MQRRVVPELIRGVQPPTLVVWGTDDDILPLQDAYAFQSDLPRCVGVRGPPPGSAVGRPRQWSADLLVQRTAGCKAVCAAGFHRSCTNAMPLGDDTDELRLQSPNSSSLQMFRAGWLVSYDR